MRINFTFIILINFIASSLLSQLDSTYKLFNNPTNFSKIYTYNNNYKIVGSNYNIDGSESVFMLDLDNKLRHSKETKAKITSLFKNSTISKNTIDGNYLAIVYESYYSPYREIYKIDNNGNILFHSSISDDSTFFPSKIIQTSDSAYLVTGYNKTLAGYYSAFLFKLNSKGNIVFHKTFTLSPPNSILGYDIVETNSNYYLLMAKENGSVQTPPYYENNSLIYKLSKSGDSLASINENKGNVSIGYSNLLITDNQEFLYNGHILDSLVFDTLARKIYYLKKPFIQLKSNNGSEIWQKTFSKISNKWDGFYTIKKLKDGNYLAVGYIYNPNNTDSSNWGYAVKISKSGVVIWEKKYRTSFLHKYNSDILFDFIEEADGNLILIGNSYKPHLNDSSTDFENADFGWALKLDYQGNMTSSIISKNPSYYSHSIKLFPNPSVEKINIEYSSEDSKIAYISIYNTEGRLIHPFVNKFSIGKGQNKFSLDITAIPTGTYFLQINSEDGRIENTRFEKK